MKNLKHFFVLFLSGISLIVLFQGCERTVKDESKDINFTNPFEFVGEIHNEGLNTILQKLDIQKGKEVDIQKICDLTENFLLSNQEYLSLDFNTDVLKQLGEEIRVELEGKGTLREKSQMYNKGTLGEHYYLELKKAILELASSDTATSFKRLNNLEEVIWLSDIPKHEKDGLLMMASVGKHSFIFWDNYYLKYSKLNASKSEDWQKTIEKLIEADGEAAIVGAIIGTIKGALEGTALLPGTGSITGAICEGVMGAVYGAIIGSLVRFIFIYAFQI